MALQTLRFAEKFVRAQMCLHSLSNRCPSRKQGDGSQRCSPTEDTSVSAVQRLVYMTQTTEYVVMQSHARNPTIYLHSQNNRVVHSAGDFFSSTKKSASWLEYQTLYSTLCIEYYRTHKHRRHHLAPKVGPSPSEPGLQTLEVASCTDPQLSSV